MRRVLLPAVVYLLLGLIISVAVAWTCALTIDIAGARTERATANYDGGWYWFVQRQARPGAARIISGRWHADDNVATPEHPADLVPPWSGLAEPSPDFASGETQSDTGDAYGHGWPWLSLWCERGRPGAAGGIRIGAGSSDGTRRPFRALPLRPIWSGLVLDTFLFAVALLGLRLAVPGFRRCVRISRHRCPRCGHPIGASATCSECGRAVRAAPRSRGARPVRTRRGRGWTRRLVIAVVLLGLGTALNVGIAWLCVVVVEPFERDEVRAHENDLFTRLYAAPGACWVLSKRLQVSRPERNTPTTPAELLPRWPGLEIPPPPIDDARVPDLLVMPTPTERFADGRGWPFISLWSEVVRPSWDSSLVNAEVRGGIRTSLAERPIPYGLGIAVPTVLPLRPVWSGFVANSLIYALSLGMLWFVAARTKRFIVRGRFRLSRGLCPECGYPIGDSPVCTECGREVGNVTG